VLCNFAEARIAQSEDLGNHSPIITYQKKDVTQILSPFGQSEPTGVSQYYVDGACWVVAVAGEIGEDWQLRAVLDVTTSGS